MAISLGTYCYAKLNDCLKVSGPFQCQKIDSSFQIPCCSQPTQICYIVADSLSVWMIVLILAIILITIFGFLGCIFYLFCSWSERRRDSKGDSCCSCFKSLVIPLIIIRNLMMNIRNHSVRKRSKFRKLNDVPHPDSELSTPLNPKKENRSDFFVGRN